MRIGYPCINRSIGCSANRTFRLASYSDERLRTTVTDNIACLDRILAWNLDYDIRFFRITSDLVPFASHPVCTFFWQEHFRGKLEKTGEFIRSTGTRISMHPDQFIVLNSPDEKVVERSVAELDYHARVLDALGLDTTAKIQIHVGGVYGDRAESIRRFIRIYNQLDPSITRRLVVENDDRRFMVTDCLTIHDQTGIPVLFDVFHHNCNNNSERVVDLLPVIKRTWKRADGILMVDYSSQHVEKRAGSHTDHIDTEDFRKFLAISAPYDMDIMLEIKDKEKSALAAIVYARGDPRFIKAFPP